MMTFNKSYALVVQFKQGIEIGRLKKKLNPDTESLNRTKKSGVGLSNNIFCSSGSNKDFNVNQIHGQHGSLEYHFWLFPHLALLKV